MNLWAECLNENGNINKRGECNVCMYVYEYYCIKTDMLYLGNM